MKHTLLSAILALIAVSCHSTRVVTPLEPGELRIGAHAGGPSVTYGEVVVPAPSSSLYLAYGWNQRTSIYTGLNLSELNYWILHQDIGATTRILGDSENNGPQLLANYGVHQFWSLTGSGRNTYPHIGLHGAWPNSSGWTPYAGINQWVTPNNMDQEWWRPYGFMGVRKLNDSWEYGIEFKALSGRARSQTQFGDWGIYLNAAYRLETFRR